MLSKCSIAAPILLIVKYPIVLCAFNCNIGRGLKLFNFVAPVWFGHILGTLLPNKTSPGYATEQNG